MPEVAITLLGGFAAAVDGQAVGERAWRLKKARELVKLLALAPGHRLHREQAMDALWQDRSPAAAANNLYQVVHAARRVLGADALVFRDELLSLEAEVDADRFEQAARDARRTGSAGAFRAALSLYGGELLPENRYDDWAALRRDQLAELHAELGREAARLGAVDGLRGLPADVSSFVGREHELADLRAMLPRTRLLSLAGTGGAGKTRLALELARAAEPDYEDGAVLVELAPIADPSLVVYAASAALDVRALPGNAPIDAVVEFLAQRRLLLVLDNCEHVLDAAAALVDAVLRGAPQVTMLTTGREPLRLPGEVVFRVPSLGLPDPEQGLGPDELLRYEAVRLFVERAAAAAPEFALDQENAADVAHICFRLDGLPLALELAAARLGALGARAIAERLDDRFRILRTGSRTAPTRQQTLEAALDWSHELLEPDERVLFRRLAIFAGGFELEAVESVCANGRLQADAVADLLGRLVEKSLVAADDVDGRRRYRLLETVRLYAGGRLAEAGEADELATAHAAWALALAEALRDSPELDRHAANLRAALDTLRARNAPELLRFCVAVWPFWLRRIDLDEAHRRLVDALAAAPERTALRVDALRAAGGIDYRAGTLACCEGHAREALELAEELGDPVVEWTALQFLGDCAIAGDDGRESEIWWQRALALARREGDGVCEALGLYSLGVARLQLGDAEGGESLIAAGVDALRSAEAAPGETMPSPLNLSETLLLDPATRPPARLVFEETLQTFLQVDRRAAIGSMLANLAGVARTRGDFDRARSLLDESERWFVEAGDERGQTDTLVRRAYLELAAGSLDAARTLLTDALDARRRASDRRGYGLALTGLGLVETAAGDYADAKQHLAEAREVFRRGGDRWGLIGALWRTADLAFACDDVDAAEEALTEALQRSQETDRERWIAVTLAGLAEVAALRGDADRADALLGEACTRLAARAQHAAAETLERRRKELTTAPQRSRKGRTDTTSATRTTRRRRE